MKDWLKIQQDVALVKKSCKGNVVPFHATVKRIVEEKYEDKVPCLKPGGLTTMRRSSCTAIKAKLASYAVEFPPKTGQANAMTVFESLSLQEEEQIRMATTLSNHDKRKHAISTRDEELDKEHEISNFEPDHNLQVMSEEEPDYLGHLIDNVDKSNEIPCSSSP